MLCRTDSGWVVWLALLLLLLLPLQDLNQQPLLMEQLDSSYDAVLCVNGIQYLTQPEMVLTEARAAHHAACMQCMIIALLRLQLAAACCSAGKV